MKSFLFFALIALVCSSNRFVNKKYVEHLKRIASYEVAEVEENHFRDWTTEEILGIVRKGTPLKEEKNLKQKYETINETETKIKKKSMKICFIFFYLYM